MRSMMAKATRVRRKFVRAIDSEVVIGEVKPTREKIVAEKYMSWSWEVSEERKRMARVSLSLDKHCGWYESLKETPGTTMLVERPVYRFEQWGLKGRTEFYRLLEIEIEAHTSQSQSQHSQNHIVAADPEAYKQSSGPSYYPAP